MELAELARERIVEMRRELRYSNHERLRATLRAEAANFWADLRERCTPLRWAVGVMLLCTITGWAYASHVIYRASNTAEHAAVDSPRTLWSVKRAGQIERWRSFQEALAAEAATYQPASPYDNRARLLLLGDSMTEAWRGTAYGEPREDRVALPEVMQETLAKRWPAPLIFGISGDQTQHVLWRLAHGELSAKMASDERLLVVLLIGTNNLAAGHSPEEVADGISTVVTRLLNVTRGKVLVNTLFPRGDGAHRLPALCPPRCNPRTGKPFRSFRPAVEKVNALINKSVPGIAKAYGGRARVINCAKLFDPEEKTAPPPPPLARVNAVGAVGAVGGAALGLLKDPTTLLRASEKAVEKTEELLVSRTAEAKPSDDVRLDLMPDRLHPNADGYRLWAGCVEDALFSFGDRQ